MKRIDVKKWIVCLMLTLAAGAHATTICWITDDINGDQVSSIDPVSGLPELKVNAGSSFTVYTFFDTDVTGSLLVQFLGYDVSDAETFGVGKDTNDGQYKKLVLSSYDNYMSDAGFFMSTVYTDASSRTTSDPLFGGRLYGACTSGFTLSGVTFSNLKVAGFTFTNNLAAGESTYLVLSDSGEGNSWTDVWGYNGDVLDRPSYALKITAVPEPVSLMLMGLGTIILARKRRR